MLNKGIILIATGHPYYGRMAYNLALSIKACEGVPVAVVHDEGALKHLNDKQREVFDHLIPLPGNYRNGIQAKLHLDELTPFDHTLYLDVDMVWIGKRSPSQLFKSMEGVPFAAIYEGDSDKPNNKYYFWADSEEIKKAYGVDKVPQLRSEVIYFESAEVFQKARSLKPQTMLNSIRMFGNVIPDELYFNIATAVLGIELKAWMPAYWPRMHNEKMPTPSMLAQGYYLLSAGSNYVSPVIKNTYDRYMIHAANKTGVTHLFPIRSKKEWLPERQKM